MAITRFVVTTQTSFTHKFLIDAESAEEAKSKALTEDTIMELQRFDGERVVSATPTTLDFTQLCNNFKGQGYI